MTKVPVSVTSRSRYFRYYAFLWGMKKTVLLILLLATACGLQQVEVDVHSGSDGVWRGPSYGSHMSGTCYALGLDYPKGHDWKSGTDDDGIECALMMFADGIPVLRVRTGDEYGVSSDPLRHRIRNGRLYSDYTDGSTTVIKEDGKEVVRYEGSEEILCLEVVKGSIHSIGIPPGGFGFTYRVDGCRIVHRDSASVFPHLDVHDGSVFFCFSDIVRNADGYGLCHYKVADGKVMQVEADPDVTKVWDMKHVAGELYMAVSLSDRSPVIISVNGRSDSSINLVNMVSCTFCDSQLACLHIRFMLKFPEMTDILWMGDKRLDMCDLGCIYSDVLVDEFGFNGVINHTDRFRGVIFDSDNSYVIPEGYAVAGKGCMTRRDETLYVALSSKTGGPPVIWTPAGTDTLDVNGPLICLR